MVSGGQIELNNNNWIFSYFGRPPEEAVDESRYSEVRVICSLFRGVALCGN